MISFQKVPDISPQVPIITSVQSEQSSQLPMITSVQSGDIDDLINSDYKIKKMPKTQLNKNNHKRQTWSQEKMAEAVSMVREKKMGLKKAAKFYEVPKTTLRTLSLQADIRPEQFVKKTLGRKPILPEDIEKQLVEYILSMESIFYGLTRMDLRRMAFQLAVRNKIPNQFKEGLAGRSWLDHFLNRHKQQLSLRRPTRMSYACTEGFTKEKVLQFFDLLDSEYKKHRYEADRIWNVGETGLIVMQSKVVQVIGLKGKRQIGALTAAERGSLVTVICAMSAGGSFLPPMMIFPWKNMSDQLMRGAPSGAIGRAHPSGWVQANLFTQWFKHFLAKTKPTAKLPVLLILDGHYSHTRNVDVIELARINHVSIISLPPHTTHKLHPLDKTFMGPLKTYYSKAIRQHMIHEHKRLTSYDIAGLFGTAYLQCTNGLYAVNGFRATGIWPFNRHIFTDADFVAADHAVIENAPTDVMMPQIPWSSSISVTPQRQITPSLTSTTPITRSCPGSSGGASSVSPRGIVPIPLLKKKRSNRGRKPSSSNLITGSPYKNLEASMAKPPNREKTLSRGRGRGRGATSATVQKDQPSTSSVKRLTRCKTPKAKRQCISSVSSDDDSIDIPLSVDSAFDLPDKETPSFKDDTACLFCDGLFADDTHGEMWVQCLMCTMWAHKDCADVENEHYICDFCK
ncbi:uncharacterized protein LOC111637281 isoform X2 [Centruroides sculpturatus]|uniref:uncharacterized protein LOC111637281 isoform X2 n=1 Tax=Centruroides sculpturatus TaxID=218467 RepID=UPI000C6D564F|nr:uncharacterized protein LOC111637281 isoform X2 [Centruroides sculpturatus]